MKPNPQQLLLFRRGPLPSQPPFTLEPSPDEIRICTSCQRQIVIQRRTAKGEILSEFCDAEGRCWNCTK
jgi:hypothetical protein